MYDAILGVMDKWERQAITLRGMAEKLSGEKTLTLREATLFLADLYDECRRDLGESAARSVRESVTET